MALQFHHLGQNIIRVKQPENCVTGLMRLLVPFLGFTGIHGKNYENVITDESAHYPMSETMAMDTMHCQRTMRTKNRILYLFTPRPFCGHPLKVFKNILVR